ncbi:MAG TPA: hypothetical protein VEY91_01080 [Candidatus Limnocylindria bacterium]|nr:hypothetical protein [Candidatus Limnocylindria bacterium]
MPAIIQICVVIVTMAVVVMAIMTLRLLVRIDGLTKSVAEGVKAFEDAIESTRASSQIHELIGTTRQIAHSLRTVAGNVEGVTQRASAISHELLDEVERPVHQAASLVRGLKAGTNFLMQRWTRRAPSNNNYSRIGPQEGGPEHA